MGGPLGICLIFAASLAGKPPDRSDDAAARLDIEEAQWAVEATCSDNCDIQHISDVSFTSEASVASPVGSTYSLHHMVGADMDGAGPNGITCVRIFNPSSPLDDIVTFDGIAEPLRPDVLGTTATVNEIHEIEPDGTRFVQITTSSPAGTNLFPAGQLSGGHLLTDACFAIGLDDPLSWTGSDTVLTAVIYFLDDGQVTIGPVDITSQFPMPWNGVLNLAIPALAGAGINGVRLEMIIEKQIDLPNDNCDDSTSITDGLFAFSTLGATTDGVGHPQRCAFGGYSQLDSDVWYRYVATCTGQLTVDLCASSYDTKVAVYDGCPRCPIEEDPLACNDDFCGLRSFLPNPTQGHPVPVVQGQCYMIRVGGFQGAQGTGTLSVECDAPTETGACCVQSACVGTVTQQDCLSQNGTWFINQTCPGFVCPGAVPANDLCDNAVRIFTGMPYVASSQNATGQDITPGCTDNDTRDVWHVWTSDCTGLVDIETCSAQSLADTSLAIFDSCGGSMLACMDDGCNGVQSRIIGFEVTQGTTYYLRVAGRNQAMGGYQILVNPCRYACCTDHPSVPTGCAMVSPTACTNNGGAPQNPGTFCLGDMSGNGVDDVCEACLPDVSIISASPTSGTVDARQPYAIDSELPRQGIGAPGEPGSTRSPILVSILPRLAELENCFAVCETVEDPLLGENSIDSVVYLGNGIYEIVLDHAITAGGVTTVEYIGSNTFAQFTNHPGNVNADFIADVVDVDRMVKCCLEATCSVPYAARSCDTDRSTLVGPLDLLRLVDVLNGSTAFGVWNNTAKPTNTACPE